MGTKIIKIKRFPIEKCSNFMAGYTQNETKCIQNLLFGLPELYYKKRKAASVIGVRPFPIISVQSMV